MFPLEGFFRESITAVFVWDKQAQTMLPSASDSSCPILHCYWREFVFVCLALFIFGRGAATNKWFKSISSWMSDRSIVVICHKGGAHSGRIFEIFRAFMWDLVYVLLNVTSGLYLLSVAVSGWF